MTSARTILLCALLGLPLVAVRAQSNDGAAEGRSWQKPAAAAADAAAAVSSPAPAAGIVPPAPLPAVRPAPDAGTAKPIAPAPSSGTASAKVETSPSAPAAVTTGANPAPADAKDAAKDTKDSKDLKDAKGKKTVVAARDLFGAAKTPAPLKARSIGWYAKGCLAGAKPLAIDGPAWQVMRLSRNRNWGHPQLIALLERFAEEAKKIRRLAGASRRRYRPAARRADDVRPCEPSGRARRRRLADARCRTGASPRRSARTYPPRRCSPQTTYPLTRKCGATAR